MWSPTHITVTVQRAKGLLSKGKNGTNNCFVTIALGKEKYQTSVKEKAETNVNWNEECELKIPDQGNRAELTLTCLHRNNLGIDEFLGQATLPLNEMDVYDRPRSKWLKLESKPGKEKKNKERGELEVRISFIVKSGSLTDLSKKDKHKSSIGQLASSVGGSLLSIGTLEKRKGIKKFAKSLSSKMHLNGKKKHKEGDDVSFSGSFASIGTPNSSHGGSRRYGQRAGEADPGVISEDEDEFVFDNLSHKSSGSSLNIRSGLHAPTQNFAPHNPSPLLGLKDKTGGKQKLPKNEPEDNGVIIDPQMEEIENEFSVRARTLPPPSKPPRVMQSGTEAPVKLDEWETKLYGKRLEIGSSDSLKRRSWEQARVPLPTIDKSEETGAAIPDKSVAETKTNNQVTSEKVYTESSSSSSSESEEDEKEIAPIPAIEPKLETKVAEHKESEVIKKPSNVDSSITVKKTTSNLLNSDTEENDFNQLNASFARLEQKNRARIFENDSDKKPDTQAFIAHESQLPQAMPRNLSKTVEKEREEVQEAKQEQIQSIDENIQNAEELRLDEQRLNEEAEALQEELRRKNEQKLREEKRREEDRMLLNFSKRSISVDDNGQRNLNILAEPAKEEDTPSNEKTKEKRMGKFKYTNRRDNKNYEVNNSNAPKSSERIIIGHEKSTSHAERRSEITAALTKKYEGKSREELMLIANGMENEALLQRQRVKELEDYLDNLLLRVMETHPKILQNPYSRTTSAKSG